MSMCPDKGPEKRDQIFRPRDGQLNLSELQYC